MLAFSSPLPNQAADLANREIQKSKTISNLRNSNGVDYAPWMNISAEDEAQIQRIAARRAAERRAKDDEKEVRGKLLEDSVGQELSGGGLKAKAIAEDQVELEWSTSAEANTAGYVIKRRMSKQEDWDIISDYRRWGPLVSKGKDGGTYRYLDSTVDIGTYLYRVSEADLDGKESDLCQVAVDVQSKEEQLGTKLKAAVIVGVAVLVVQTALNLDPIQ